MAAHGVSPSFLIGHIRWWGAAFRDRLLEAERANLYVPCASALRAITLDAAWQCRSEDITGSIEAGKFADLVLLEDDPRTVDPARISRITVSETRLGGEIRFPRTSAAGP